jgi:hypothetical protein
VTTLQFSASSETCSIALTHDGSRRLCRQRGDRRPVCLLLSRGSNFQMTFNCKQLPQLLAGEFSMWSKEMRAESQLQMWHGYCQYRRNKAKMSPEKNFACY